MDRHMGLTDKYNDLMTISYTNDTKFYDHGPLMTRHLPRGCNYFAARTRVTSLPYLLTPSDRSVGKVHSALEAVLQVLPGFRTSSGIGSKEDKGSFLNSGGTFSNCVSYTWCVFF